MSLKRSFGLLVAMVAMVSCMAVSAMAGDWFGRRHETCSSGNCGGVATAVVQAPVHVVQAARQEVQIIRSEVANVIAPSAPSAPSAPHYSQPQPVSQCQCQPVSQCCQSPAVTSSGGLAQQKAELQASRGRMQHVGGSLGNGRYEGVGFSTAGPDQAIAASCYWGQKNPVDIGVSCNGTGCYATVLYQ